MRWAVAHAGVGDIPIVLELVPETRVILTPTR